MLAPAIPDNETDRIASLRALQILDTNPERRFDRITELTQQVMGVPIAYIAMVDSDRQWFKSKCGLTTDQTGRDVSFCGHAILSDSVMVVPDTLLDERFTDNPLVLEDPKIRFYAGQPLAGQNGHNVGTLCIADRLPRELQEHELELLKLLGEMAQHELNLIDLIRTQKELIDAKSMLIRVRQKQASELQEAAGYVRSLIDPPITSGPIQTEWLFEASSDLGGDILGHRKLPDGRIAMFLLDVMGHGIGAALHASAISSAIRSQSLANCDYGDPLEVFRSLDEHFLMSEHDDRFFTMFYCVLNPENGNLEYVNAGHPPAMVFNQSGLSAKLESTASLVGLGEQLESSKKEITLAPGSDIWIYSDGAIELNDHSGSELGINGLRDALTLVRSSTPAAESQVQALRDLLASFSGRERFTDDLSILKVAWNPSS